MVTLPQPQNIAEEWRVADYRRDVVTVSGSNIPGDTRLVASLDIVPDDEIWEIERVVVNNTVPEVITGVTTGRRVPNGGIVRCDLFDGYVDDYHRLDFSDAGARDVADMNSPIRLLSNSQLLIRWDITYSTIVGPTSICTALVQYTILRKS